MNKPEYANYGNVELKPCPFCGSDDIVVFCREYDYKPDANGNILTRCGFNDDNTIELVYSAENQVQYGVMCNCCHIETGVDAIYLSVDQTFEAWNRRVPSEI